MKSSASLLVKSGFERWTQAALFALFASKLLKTPSRA